jgi:hypothetical protein
VTDELTYPGEIVGFKALAIRLGGPIHPARLVSIFGGDDVRCSWPTDGWFRAECPNGHEQVPHESCGCGIYAVSSRRRVVEGPYLGDDEGLVALVRVALAGKVAEGARGWRAEKARVLALWVDHGRWKAGNLLGAQYRVPVGLTNLGEGDA